MVETEFPAMPLTEDTNKTPAPPLDQTLERLRQLDIQYRKTRAPLDELEKEKLRDFSKFKENLVTLHELEEEFRSDHQELVHDLVQCIGFLCAAYLQADATDRVQIRDFFADKKIMRVRLLDELGNARLHIPGNDTIGWLRHALAAASIEDNQTDFRDTCVALDDIRNAVIQAGIDPKPHFVEVAALSSPAMSRFLLSRYIQPT